MGKPKDTLGNTAHARLRIKVLLVERFDAKEPSVLDVPPG